MTRIDPARRWRFALVLAATVVLAASCQGSVGGPSSAVLLALFTAVSLWACSDRQALGDKSDGGQESAGSGGSGDRGGTGGSGGTGGTGGVRVGTGGAGGGGYSGRCCQGGRTSTCYCPPMWACNFGLGEVHCGDGTCYFAFGLPPSSSMCGADGGAGDASRDADTADRANVGDAAAADAARDGAVDAAADGPAAIPARCCLGGKTSVCYCPLTASCNFGLGEVHCGDGRCLAGPLGVDGAAFCAADGGAGTDGAGGATAASAFSP